MKIIEIIKSIIGHGLSTFRVLDKTRIDINIKPINSIPPQIPEVYGDRD
jgi:hypothetical protein